MFQTLILDLAALREPNGFFLVVTCANRRAVGDQLLGNMQISTLVDGKTNTLADRLACLQSTATQTNIELALPRPHITTFSELTIDGRLTLGGGRSSTELFAFYGPQLQRWFHRQRAEHDAIMVGAGTVRSDNPKLTVRHVSGRNPLRVIPTNDGNFPVDSNILIDGQPTLLAVPDSLPDELMERLGRGPVTIMRCGRERVDLHLLMQGLAGLGIRSLMVEGGSRLLAALFAGSLVDRIVIKHIPVIAGAMPGEDIGSPFLEAAGLSLQLSRWRVVDWRVIGGVGVSIYEPLRGSVE